MKVIYKYGIAFVKDNQLLLCEPYAFEDLILPGGIREKGESYLENLIREIKEDLGSLASLNVSSIKYLGNFRDIAAGRNDTSVEIELYNGIINGALCPSSEIKNLIWVSPKDTSYKLSPIVQNKIIPFLIKNKYLSVE